MGCCSAKARVTAYAPSTAIDQRLVAALKKREAQQQAEEQKEGRRRSFTVDTLAMRLQHVSKVLVHIRRAFHEFDADGNGSIDVQELKSCMLKFGATMTDDEISNVFATSARLHPTILTFKEFVSALCIGTILDLIPHPDASMQQETVVELSAVKTALAHIVEAWMMFDTRHEGAVHRDEVEAALAERGHSDHKQPPQLMSLSAARWQEMDYDSDGFIVFPEFVMAYMKWAGVEDDDEDE